MSIKSRPSRPDVLTKMRALCNATEEGTTVVPQVATPVKKAKKSSLANEAKSQDETMVRGNETT
jgi:hypothetical protein